MSDYLIGLLKISDFVFTCGYAGFLTFSKKLLDLII